MITLTDTAAAHINEQIQQRGSGLGIRVGVKTTGCSGLAYILEFVDEISEHDETFVSQSITVAVDPKSMPYLAGTVMDFVTEGLQSGFMFTNPNSKGECGCGESFTV